MQENVLINEEGDALLSDFGLATVLGDEPFYTASHHGGGSFRYMAPELFRGEQRTCSADVYSFANLVYEVTFSSNADVTTSDELRPYTDPD